MENRFYYRSIVYERVRKILLLFLNFKDLCNFWLFVFKGCLINNINVIKSFFSAVIVIFSGYLIPKNKAGIIENKRQRVGRFYFFITSRFNRFICRVLIKVNVG